MCVHFEAPNGPTTTRRGIWISRVWQPTLCDPRVVGIVPRANKERVQIGPSVMYMGLNPEHIPRRTPLLVLHSPQPYRQKGDQPLFAPGRTFVPFEYGGLHTVHTPLPSYLVRHYTP